MPRVHYFSPRRVVVRDILAKHPLFLSKQLAPGCAIHALITGFGSAGSHLVEAIFLTSLVPGRLRPRITVLSLNRRADRALFLSTRPSIAEKLDVEFIDLGALDHFETTAGRAARLLRARDAATPVTAVFLMSDSFIDNGRLAMKIDRIRRKTGRLTGPVRALESWNEPGSASRLSQGLPSLIDGFVPFGLSDDQLETQICDPDRRDRLACALHENYLRNRGESHSAWSELPEEKRRANVNAADHALAKLHALGFDVSQWLAGQPAGAMPSVGESDAEFIRVALRATTNESTSQLAQLVEIEHERWMIERWLDGWTYGQPRDEIRLKHDKLLDWKELCARYPKQSENDKAQIEALIVCLTRNGDRRFPLERDPTVLGNGVG